MKKFYFGISLLALGSFSLAQIGINTSDPQSSLHIVPSNPSSPTGTDGVLIPRVSDYPSAPAGKGLLIFLDSHPTDSDGFYYWDGEDWKSFIIDSFNRNEEKEVYVFTGVGYSGTGGTGERTVYFTNSAGNDLTGFSVSNNQITIGKKGKYLVSFNSALKKGDSTPVYRATYNYKIKLNGSTQFEVSASIPNENESATGVSTSNIMDLDVGDVINVTVQKNNESHSHNLYTGYGTNAITLSYLID
jgi:hypothetical protein